MAKNNVWHPTSIWGKILEKDLSPIPLNHHSVAPFRKENEPYGEFSNFYLAEMEVSVLGKNYKVPCIEHIFQALKFPVFSNDFQETITAKEPYQAKEKGRQGTLRPDWDLPLQDQADFHTKDLIMYHVLLLKFTQHPKLRDKLLQSKGSIPIENTQDSYWGIGKDGRGQNRLGLLLMAVQNTVTSPQKPRIKLPNDICYQATDKGKGPVQPLSPSTLAEALEKLASFR